MVKIIQTYRKFSYLDILILQYIRKAPAPCPPSEPDDLNDFPIWDAKILLKSLLFSTLFLKVLLSSNLSDNSEEFSLFVWNSTHIAFAYVISDNAGSNGTALRLSEWKGKIELRDRSVEEEEEQEEEEKEEEEEEGEEEASKGGKERKKGNKDERKKKESNEVSKQEKKLDGD